MHAHWLLIILGLIVGYLILTAPEQSANTAQNTGSVLGDAIERFGVFVDSVMDRTADSRPFDQPSPTPSSSSPTTGIHT